MGYCTLHHQRYRRTGSLAPTGTAKGSTRRFIDGLTLAHEECIPWPFQRNPKGYGRAGFRDSTGSRLAHRIVCEKFHGPPPSGKPLALHGCGKGHEGCVNPAHLYWGTHADNTADAAAHGTQPIGSMCSYALLHESQIPAIRADMRTVAEIAMDYGVSEGAINNVLYGNSWKHVPWT